MINFNNFILGESGIEVQSMDEATSLINVCIENDINITFIKPEDYKMSPYWYVKDGELEISEYFCDMAESVCDVWTYSEFVMNHEK